MFPLWGGEARYAVGAQIRIDGYSYFTETLGEDGRTVLSGGLAGRVGASPREKVRAYFAEVSLPIVGPANSRPWVHSLLLSLQARYDSYETDGAHGGENLVREFKIPEIAERDADGKITNLNSVYLNLAEKINEIASVELEYSFDTGIGSFLAALSYLRVVEESFRATPESKQVSQLGTISGSNEYKLIGSASWRLDRWRTDLFAHHTPAYLNNNVGNAGRLPPLKVEPLTTIDVALTYRFDIGLRLRVGGRNVFDARSPTISFRMPYDASRWDARGRVLFFAMDWEI